MEILLKISSLLQDWKTPEKSINIFFGLYSSIKNIYFV